tara:strand:- start:1659 stop:2081 length:423 start_codon:yes stop_codon:yes gene_type:complete
MKLVTKLTVAAITATFMFGAINLTWGNAYTNTDNALEVTSNQFGVWLDVNDAMAFGWEGDGIKVGFDGPAGMQVRLGYDTVGTVGATLGMGRTWWTSTGDGWGTSLSTAMDFYLTGDPAGGGGNPSAGDWVITMNLGFGF